MAEINVYTDLNIATKSTLTLLTVPVIRSASGGNVPLVIQATGTGGIQLQPTTNTLEGGNTRGNYAIDLQIFRSSASHVASGSSACVLGASNTASGQSAVAMGNANTSSGYAAIAGGESCQATGYAATALGRSNSSSGNSSIALGSGSRTRGIANLLALGSNTFRNQLTIVNLTAQTFNDNWTVLTSIEGSPSIYNQLSLINNSAIAFTGLLVAIANNSETQTVAWEFRGVIKKGTTNASTLLLQATYGNRIGEQLGTVDWEVYIYADTTNGALAIGVTGQFNKEIRWNCTLYASEAAI